MHDVLQVGVRFFVALLDLIEGYLILVHSAVFVHSAVRVDGADYQLVDVSVMQQTRARRYCLLHCVEDVLGGGFFDV